jgi:hypothetical protein
VPSGIPIATDVPGSTAAVSSHQSGDIPAYLPQAIQRFDSWLSQTGPASFDPYDVWGTRYGLLSRAVYYKRPWAGLPLIAPLLLLEIVAPSARQLFVAKERYATADAQLALAYCKLFRLKGDARFLENSRRLAAELVGYSVPGFRGLCWGYPFDWRHVNGVSPKQTPFITTTPYCFEAFRALYDITGDQQYAEWGRSVAEFVAHDLKDTPYAGGSAAGSYSPFDDSKVVNASAYRAMVLFGAAEWFGVPEFRAKAEGNLSFILASQLENGSWLYSADNPREAFIDHFHTCFVLKNLWKLNRRRKDPAVADCIRRGFEFYRRELFTPDGIPKSFALEPRKQIVRLEMYNYAEAITLGSLLAPMIPEALTMAQRLAEQLCREFQTRAGHFVTRVYRGGWRHSFPFLRWPQAQIFLALTNLLEAETRGGAS